MKKTLILPLVLLAFTATSQETISQFTWETDVTTADVGPNATSVSGSAKVDGGGATLNGLNAGTPKADLELTLPGASFDKEGCDISVDYHREEGTGYFFKRGNSLEFGLSGGKLRIKYRVDDGMGGWTQVTATNLYTIPNDDTYRNYRFYYDPGAGFAEVLVDGASVWDNSGSETPGQNMYWTSAGDMIVGNKMDGTGYDDTFMDNLLFIDFPNNPLPVTLTDWTAEVTPHDEVELSWTTSSEINNDYFVIERSTNGLTFDEIGKIGGAGNSTIQRSYSFIDSDPAKGMSYYRLKQVDFNGESETFNVLAIEFVKSLSEACVLKVYPNPCVGNCTVSLEDCEMQGKEIEMEMYDMSGNLVKRRMKHSDSNTRTRFDIDATNNLTPGVYIVRAGSGEMATSEKVIVR